MKHWMSGMPVKIKVKMRRAAKVVRQASPRATASNNVVPQSTPQTPRSPCVMAEERLIEVPEHKARENQVDLGMLH
ncbi:unnamed protein product [Vitrella brassicaformis CCMP3155]|uniref:Uncharacterized protein n=1 Tax=Vitrella brassicaformis (strain CCMP3155) TaxID=1169540 RepID=A0A0G4F3X4_VITBC|nr:unnamed protein product [Vitrella brassicaformis CCMP3155]|eukprot:CEM06925.1 unnamed protein product [Vitrella brassicaformis CCMP3155]